MATSWTRRTLSRSTRLRTMTSTWLSLMRSKSLSRRHLSPGRICCSGSRMGTRAISLSCGTMKRQRFGGTIRQSPPRSHCTRASTGRIRMCRGAHVAHTWPPSIGWGSSFGEVPAGNVCSRLTTAACSLSISRRARIISSRGRPRQTRRARSSSTMSRQGRNADLSKAPRSLALRCRGRLSSGLSMTSTLRAWVTIASTCTSRPHASSFATRTTSARASSAMACGSFRGLQATTSCRSGSRSTPTTPLK
mmetsp:Transcript_8647/g.17580  ORF Transcript_8647/g.17580 Transcript_8647/m.17580 type:complete len:249 (+) Transcript_8647:357-1103(+)